MKNEELVKTLISYITAMTIVIAVEIVVVGAFVVKLVEKWTNEKE